MSCGSQERARWLKYIEDFESSDSMEEKECIINYLEHKFLNFNKEVYSWKHRNHHQGKGTNLKIDLESINAKNSKIHFDKIHGELYWKHLLDDKMFGRYIQNFQKYNKR